MSNCKHFPDADDHCLICARGQMELHVLTVNLPQDEVEFPTHEVRVFTDMQALNDYADMHHPLWTSMVIVALPPRKDV